MTRESYTSHAWIVPWCDGHRHRTDPCSQLTDGLYQCQIDKDENKLASQKCNHISDGSRSTFFFFFHENPVRSNMMSQSAHRYYCTNPLRLSVSSFCDSIRIERKRFFFSPHMEQTTSSCYHSISHLWSQFFMVSQDCTPISARSNVSLWLPSLADELQRSC